MTTGEKITKCRKEKGLTQEQLAQALGVTRQAVSRWEGDIAFPETDNLTKMSRLFGVSCDWLLNYDGELPKTAQEEKNGVFTFDLNSLHFEYKSKTHWGKLPLVHINIGIGRVAKGVFALGLVSTGLVSVGVLSFGLLAFGSICLGLLAFGAIPAGGDSVRRSGFRHNSLGRACDRSVLYGRRRDRTFCLRGIRFGSVCRCRRRCRRRNCVRRYKRPWFGAVRAYFRV